MKHIRVIPRLDIKGPNLVKGIHLEGLRVLGAPENFAKYYYEQGADELIFQDSVASLYERKCLTEIITRTAEEIFIPLTVGGGIRNLDDINNVLRAGADKVSLNTAVIKNPKFILEASRAFGSSTIVVAIEAIKQKNGDYLAYTDNGREYTGIEIVEWAKKSEDLGAGEILLTSIDNEGTGYGFDLELIKIISSNVSIPVIAHGGASSIKHIIDAVEKGNADAVAIASMLHYSKKINSLRNTINIKNEGNTEFLKRNIGFKNFGETNIHDIKNKFTELNIPIRI